MSRYWGILAKAAKLDGTRSYVQGPAAYAVLWAVSRYALGNETPDPIIVSVYLFYSACLVVGTASQVVRGRWTPARWADRTLLFGLPLPIFYGYSAFLLPEYFPIFVVFVLGCGFPSFGVVRIAYWILWYAVYLGVFFGLCWFFNNPYPFEHLPGILMQVAAFGIILWWLLQVSEYVRKLNHTLTRNVAETRKRSRDVANLNKELAEREKRIQEDLALARRLQQDTLPDIGRYRTGKLRLASAYLPLESMGGDFFDVIDLDEDTTGLFIADVVGHGVQAALVTMMTKAAFYTHCRGVYDPAVALGAMNAALYNFLERPDLYVSAAYCLVRRSARTITYSNAGPHPTLIIRPSDDSIFELATEGLFLGMEADTGYESREFPLEPGDRILMYTDGLFEARSSGGKFYGEGRLEEFLIQSKGGDVDIFLAGLVEDLFVFMGTREREDDIAILAGDFLPESEMRQEEGQSVRQQDQIPANA